MSRIKFTPERPFPDEDRILAQKDFSKILTGASAMPKPITKWLWGGISAAVVIGTIITIYLLNEKDPVQNAPIIAQEISATGINPPIAEIDIPFENYSIDPLEESSITTESGSKIRIPDNAFVDKDGHEVTEPVDIQYREFKDPLDFFKAGIPMEYDSAGTSYTFVSAGMLELNGYSNGDEVFLAEGKLIDIDMVSNNNSKEFNLYELDKNSNQWIYRGKDVVIEQAGEIQQIPIKSIEPIKETNTVKNDIPDVQPVKPRRQNKTRHSFALALEAGKFPELDQYTGVLFEVSRESQDFNPVWLRLNWEKIYIQPLSNDNYTITLQRMDTSISFVAYPVLDDKDFEDAMSFYNEYMSRKKENELDFVSNEEPIVQTEILQNDPTIIRRFSIGRTGIWNCDVPVPKPEGKVVSPIFANSNKANLEYNEVCLVSKPANALFRFPQNMPVQLNPDNDNVLWFVTSNKEIAIAEQSELNNIRANGTQVIQVETYPLDEGLEKVQDMLDSKYQAPRAELSCKAYPNPFTDKITIEANMAGEYHLEIFASNGQKMRETFFEGTRFTWNLSSLAKGTYFIHIRHNKGNTLSRTVIRN